jgi:hypothetical protein
VGDIEILGPSPVASSTVPTSLYKSTASSGYASVKDKKGRHYARIAYLHGHAV